MAIQNIKRWQWILLSLIVGLALGYIHHLPSQDWQKAFGDTIPQRQFEEGLTREQSGLRWFRNLVIYPERVDNLDSTKAIYVVAGEYFNGKQEMQDGQRVAIWRPRCFIVEGPYQPLSADPQSPTTIFSYLQSIPGVRYTYAWWRDPRLAIVYWTAGSLLIMGLIWPTVINLLVFGSLFRPAEEKGIDLSKVSSRSPQPAHPTSAADLAAVEKMGAALEAKLAADASPASLTPPAAPPPAPLKPLTTAPLEVAAADPNREEKAFGQNQDDFYPTERHQPPPNAQ